jgi:hypothetical protein
LGGTSTCFEVDVVVDGDVVTGHLPLASRIEPSGHIGIIWIKPPPAPVVLPGYTGSDRAIGVQISSSWTYPGPHPAPFTTHLLPTKWASNGHIGAIVLVLGTGGTLNNRSLPSAIGIKVPFVMAWDTLSDTHSPVASSTVSIGQVGVTGAGDKQIPLASRPTPPGQVGFKVFVARVFSDVVLEEDIVAGQFPLASGFEPSGHGVAVFCWVDEVVAGQLPLASIGSGGHVCWVRDGIEVFCSVGGVVVCAGQFPLASGDEPSGQDWSVGGVVVCAGQFPLASGDEPSGQVWVAGADVWFAPPLLAAGVVGHLPLASGVEPSGQVVCWFDAEGGDVGVVCSVDWGGEVVLLVPLLPLPPLLLPPPLLSLLPPPLLSLLPPPLLSLLPPLLPPPLLPPNANLLPVTNATADNDETRVNTRNTKIIWFIFLAGLWSEYAKLQPHSNGGIIICNHSYIYRRDIIKFSDVSRLFQCIQMPYHWLYRLD